jgi:hypothetical protein
MNVKTKFTNKTSKVTVSFGTFQTGVTVVVCSHVRQGTEVTTFSAQTKGVGKNPIVFDKEIIFNGAETSVNEGFSASALMMTLQ